MSSNLSTHIYYDLSTTNNNTSGNSVPINLNLNDTRSIPFLEDPSMYFASVVRLNIDTGASLPVFIPQVILGQSNPNLLSYSISLKYKTFVQTNNIIYIPNDATQPIATNPLISQDLSSQYYWIYSYQLWQRMINQTLLTCFNALKVTVIAAGDALPSNYQPYFEYDPFNCSFILNADQLGYDQYVLTHPITMFMNSALYTIFNNFQISITTNTVNPYQFNIYSMNGQNILQAGAVYYLQMYQEQSTIALINPVESIVLTTGLLPISSENIGLPKLTDANGRLVSSGNNANLSPIISDFQIPFSALDQYRPSIQYTPQSEYRLFDLFGTGQLSNISINILWKDTYGIFHNLYLQPGSSASFKLLFRRRDFFIGH